MEIRYQLITGAYEHPAAEVWSKADSGTRLDFSGAENVTPVPLRCACNEADIGEKKILQFVLGKE